VLEELIKNFYLTEKEAKIYLANLELGRSRVSLIAKKAGLNRITTYEILKKLLQLGVANSALYGNVKTFQVIKPEILLEKMESRLKLAKNFLPHLLLISKIDKDKPNFAFYDGAEGLRTIYEDTLSCHDKTIYNIANPQNLLSTIGQNFFEEYLKKRLRRKIQVKVLLPDTVENKKYWHEVKKNKREVKFFDNKKYQIPNEILLYDNKVAMLSFSSNVGVIVEDREITNSMKMLWQMLWDSLK